MAKFRKTAMVLLGIAAFGLLGAGLFIPYFSTVWENPPTLFLDVIASLFVCGALGFFFVILSLLCEY